MSDDKPTPEDRDENLTTSSRERWEYLGTVVSILILSSLVLLVLGSSYGLLSLAAIGQSWFLLYSTICLMAATWVFGKGTLKAVQKFTSSK
jgi:hypothetical protein